MFPPFKVPWSREGLLRLLDLTNDWSSKSGGGPILVHCMDGASQSGLFVAAHIICEQMETERQVDVFHTVKHLKSRRKHCINSLVSGRQIVLFYLGDDM